MPGPVEALGSVQSQDLCMYQGLWRCQGFWRCWAKEAVHDTQLLEEAREHVTVETQEGPLRGELLETYTGNPMFRFLGIPHAEPPVGDLRFQPPVKKAAWSEVRDALSMASHCPQRKSGLPSGDEDCLYLNVYGPGTPSQSATKKAVMVWIHGGCFTEGSGESAKPNYFVDNDVIVVSINYRLGLLGFLSTGDGVVPGNMGLKDQTEALRWVQRNIAAFGGDPDKVTIFGQSAGGASVHYHVLSSSSKGEGEMGFSEYMALLVDNRK
ncbi:venom carboxylesterase-6-like [Schistocerca serialis cubense]|uniref:venom carboxylesterase-6-like n=1 Tax=Schistocerca serialis cubense TaxID=2023355 RepID=UPI00214F1AE4|nr:venom carboxylesterase-6-like [Schistocerca serialis cubense]